MTKKLPCVVTSLGVSERKNPETPPMKKLKNQARFSNKYWLPPELSMKNEVCRLRSKATIRRAAIRTGAASTISPEVVSTPQQKIGSRLQVKPGARIDAIVTIRLSPSRIIER